MSSLSRLPFVSALAAACFVAAPAARAVIVDGANGTGTANTTPPYPAAGLANVGVVNFGPPSSAVYIGNNWALTADHIAGSNAQFIGATFTVGGSPFTIDSAHQFQNSDSSNADLLAFHLTTTPALPSLVLSAATPTAGTPMSSMGNGLSRAATMTLQTDGRLGYNETTPQVTRWGTNVTTNVNGQATYLFPSLNGNVTTIASTFDASGSGGTSSELQLSMGDSGGGAFNSSSNVLIGINEGTGSPFNNEPANVAEYGDISFYTDIATYRSQIVTWTGVPEPASAAVLAAGGGLLLLRRRPRLR